VKCGLLGLHLLYQFLDSIKDWLIRDAGRHGTVMFDFTVEFDTLFTHGTRLKVTGGKQTGHLLSYDGGRAILFQPNYDRLSCGLRNHAALVYLMGDGSGRLPGHRAYQPGSAPKLYTVALRKNLGLRDGLFIVGARQRLVIQSNDRHRPQ
jgi:hypothetical protein